MATNEEQLALEWRAIILDKLKNLENGQVAIQKDLSHFTNSYASVNELNSVKAEVEKLKLYKAKVAGIVIAANSAAIFFGWLIQLYLNK